MHGHILEFDNGVYKGKFVSGHFHCKFHGTSSGVYMIYKFVQFLLQYEADVIQVSHTVKQLEVICLDIISFKFTHGTSFDLQIMLVVELEVVLSENQFEELNE